MHLPTITPSGGATPDHDGSRRQFMVSAAGAALLPLASPAQAAVTLEGVTLDETIMVGNRKLVLNGAGVRRRGYFKADVTALYLPEKRTTPESIFKLDGYRRIQLNILRDFTSSTISRIFISDFKQAATEEEFKKLIEVISLVGGAYSNVKRVTKGDVVDLDWVPGKGWMAFMNGKALQVEGAGADAINNELAYQVYLRMYIGASAPEDLRNGLLGLTKLNKV